MYKLLKMAKDRFSKFKPINWNPAFKYAPNTLMEKQIKRKRMESKEFNMVTGLLKFPLNKWEIDFVNSILKWNKEMTIGQIKVVRNIVKKYNKNKKQTNTQAKQHVHLANTEG